MLLKVLASRRREQAAAVTLPSVGWANFDLWASCGPVELLRVLETGPLSSTSLRIIYVPRSPSRRRPSALLPSVCRRDDRLRGAHGRLWYYCNWAGPMDLEGGGLGAQEWLREVDSCVHTGVVIDHTGVDLVNMRLQRPYYACELVYMMLHRH